VTFSQAPFFVFLIPFITAFLLPAAERLKKGVSINFSVAAFAVAFALSLFVLNTHQYGERVIYNFGGWAQPLGIAWRADPLSAIMVVMICGIAALSTAGTRKAVLISAGQTHVTYCICRLLLTAGLIGMVFTNDLFNLFVFLEISSLAGYALMGMGRDARSSYASLKYLLTGSLGASLYLLGVGYLYAATGTLNMDDMTVRLASADGTRTIQTGILLLFLGLSIKMGLFPFHGWQPDVYNHALDAPLTLIAPLVTKVAAYALLRILFWVVLPGGINIQTFLLLLKIFGILAVVAGSIMAFRQKDIKRLLAYSSISNMGLIAIGFALARPEALSGALLHMLNHSLATAGFFLIAAALAQKAKVRQIEDLRGIRGKMPWTCAWLLLCALSLAGIPPLAGFFSKWYLLVAALAAQEFLLAGVIAVSSLLTALYLFKILEVTSFTDPFASTAERETWADSLPAGTAAITLLVLGLFSPVIYQWLTSVAFKGVG